jgi:uncharacterized protein
MKKIFADAHYWIALANPQDHYHAAAKRISHLFLDALFITTEEVLTEFLNGYSKGPVLRNKALEIIQLIQTNSNIKIVPQSHESFIGGLHRYRHRLDKEYSLTDCISMNVMDKEVIREILTNDRHFAQEGFHILIE